MPTHTFSAPADGAWHCIGENVTSISAPTTLCEVDIREDGTGWVRNAGRFPYSIEFTTIEKEPTE